MGTELTKLQDAANLMTISSSENLLNALLSGNKLAVSFYLSKFKERGFVVHEKTLAIRSEERIPVLAQNSEIRYQMLIALVAAIKSAMNNINLKNPMNEDQVIDLADAIINQSNEDNLAIEDVLLFLQRLVVGEWKIYDRMDIPIFFELFENYRQERHEVLLNKKEEQHAQYKAMGRYDQPLQTPDMSRDGDAKTTLELMQTMYGKDI